MPSFLASSLALATLAWSVPPPPRPGSMTLTAPPPVARPAGGGDAGEIHPLLVDTHADTTQRIVYQGANFVGGIPGAHLDLSKMLAGRVDAQFFSIFVLPARTPPDSYFTEALAQIEAVQNMVAASKGRLAVARTASDVRDNAARGIHSVLFGVEGGHALGNVSEAKQLAHLGRLASEGVRYMTLTWTNSNPIGGSSGDDGDGRGLTEFGERLLDRMEKLGVIVDLSHVSDPLFWDAIRYARKPVILSHSNARALHDHPRNVTDDVMRACARTGGVVGLNGIGIFLGNNDSSTDAFVRHVDYVVQLLGREHVALGIDYVVDQKEVEEHMAKMRATFPPGLGYEPGVRTIPPEQLPEIVERLLHMGYAEDDLRGLLGTNLLRVAKAVWKTPTNDDGIE